MIVSRLWPPKESMKITREDEKQKTEEETKNEEPIEWFGGWLPTSKWVWISLVVLVILIAIFKQ